MTLFCQFSKVVLPESTYSSLSGSSLLLDFTLSYEKFPSFRVRFFAHIYPTIIKQYLFGEWINLDKFLQSFVGNDGLKNYLIKTLLLLKPFLNASSILLFLFII